MGIAAPAVSEQNCLDPVIRGAKRHSVENIDKCLIFAPDAVGLQMFRNYRSVFDPVLASAPIAVPLISVIPPKTPVCYASMFSGSQPRMHGIGKYEKPVLTCDTIFDALIRAGKKVAIVAIKGHSVDLIFRKRNIRYFSELNDLDVTRWTTEIVESGNYDCIVAYHCEYDETLHAMTPFCPEAIQALQNHISAFAQLAKTVDDCWHRYNRIIVFAPDHGAHIDPESGKGVHGDNIPEDMDVQHYFGIKPGRG